MCKRHLSAAVAVAFAVGASHCRAQSAPSRIEAGSIGRYQLVRASDNLMFMIDTVTGQCWSRLNDGRWRDAGNPTQPTSRNAPRTEAGIPPKLNLPEGSVEMTLMQREERSIPGSEGTVRIRIGDITEGQVLVAIVTDDDLYLHEQVYLHQGDMLPFPVGQQQYTLHVEELRNMLIGDDSAKIVISRESSTTKNRRKTDKQIRP